MITLVIVMLKLTRQIVEIFIELVIAVVVIESAMAVTFLTIEVGLR